MNLKVQGFFYRLISNPCFSFELRMMMDAVFESVLMSDAVASMESKTLFDRELGKYANAVTKRLQKETSWRWQTNTKGSFPRSEGDEALSS